MGGTGGQVLLLELPGGYTGPMAKSAALKLKSGTAKQQLAGRARWNAARSAAGADFFTAGYSGRTVAELIAAIGRFGVRTVLDIRQNAISVHRPDASKPNLARSLAVSGIGYVHAPELGIPPKVRAEAAGSRDVLWQWYDPKVAAAFPTVQRFREVGEGPVVVLCSELDPNECHRHRLALALERLGLHSFDL